MLKYDCDILFILFNCCSTTASVANKGEYEGKAVMSGVWRLYPQLIHDDGSETLNAWSLSTQGKTMTERVQNTTEEFNVVSVISVI